MIVVLSAGIALSAALALVVVGLRSQVAFFQTPSEVLEGQVEPGRSLRVGGLVTQGSVRTLEGSIEFELADDVANIAVVYAGVLPSLFREGQCVIAEGAIGSDGRLAASRVLAKHDESYQPREIGDAPRLARSCGAVQAAEMSGAAASE